MPHTHRNPVIFFAVALTFAITMMGTTMPTPLYPIYQRYVLSLSQRRLLLLPLSP
jgi:hypothetical protein